MTFQTFSLYLQSLEDTAPRLEKTTILSNLFSELQSEITAQEQIGPACYLMQGRLVPRYESLEFQLSVKMVLRAIARVAAMGSHATNTSSNQAGALNLFEEVDYSEFEKEITKRYKALGDVGLVVAEILDSQTDGHVGEQADAQANSALLDVYSQLAAIAQEGGSGSQEKKVSQLQNLFVSLDPISAKFVARIIIGKLRLGFSTMTILDALSWAKKGDKSDAKILDEAYQKKADIGKLAAVYLLETEHVENKNVVLDSVVTSEQLLESYVVETGVPVVPALCQRLNSAQEIIDKMGEVLVEPKYDGLRIQIHIKKEENNILTKAFTRNLEDVSHMFPELLLAAQQLGVQSCILDAEAIGFSPETGKLLPFQETITRKRKHGVAEQAESVPIRFYVFDVLCIDDESLLDKPLTIRKEKLLELIGKPLDEIEAAKNPDQPLVNTEYITTTDPVELRSFHENQLGDGLEGAVIKKVDSKYRSGRKGWRWVKIKEEEGTQGKLSDTIDCIIMGYYAGRGKRTAFGIGAFLVGVPVADSDHATDEIEIQTIAKIGTGLSDEQLTQIKDLADAEKTPEKPKNYTVDKNLYPDVWIYPKIVVEVAADEITRSPIHTAGKALRFPRLLKIRDDKSWEQATNTEELDSIGL